MIQLIDIINEDLEMSLQGIESKLSPLKNKTILITGGTGFIGSWLMNLAIFLNENYHYNIKLFLVAREWNQENIIFFLRRYTYIYPIRQDVRNYFDVPPDVNYILHAAASPDTRFHASQPLKTIETIVNGTTNVFQAATRLSDLQNIVHISSGLVYGKSELNSYQEETSFGKLDCSQLNSVYAESKRLSETIAISYKNQFRLPLSIVRPFTFIGAFQNLEKPWAFNSLLRDALLKKPLRILGSGDVQRGYIYGSDVAVWLFCVLANAKSGSVYNIGGENAISLKDLALLISTSLHHKPKIEINYHNSLRNDFHWVADTNKIQKELGVSQKVDISTAIMKTIEFYATFQNFQ
jgi:dTDP-glucose 4,6-dehydratase